MRHRDLREYALVGGQVVAITGLLLPGAPRWPLPRAAKAAAVGASVGGFGLLGLGLAGLGSQLTPFPSPTPSSTLRTDGVFGLTRHPMYTGGILGAAGVATLRRRVEPVVAFAALVALLNVKVRYEESLLRDRFGSAYDDYAASVPRLLPRPHRHSG